MTSHELEKSGKAQTDKLDKSTFSKMNNKLNAPSTRNKTNKWTDRDNRMSQRAVTKTTNTTKKRGKSVEGKQDEKKLNKMRSRVTTKLRKDKKKL